MVEKKRGAKTTRKADRLQVAQKDLAQMLEEIRPFVKPRTFKVRSTAGEWRESSELILSR
jgi:hypothetical protein